MDNQNPNRRNPLAKVLIGLIFVGFIGFMIYFFVNLNRGASTPLYITDFVSSDGTINLKYEILSINEVYQGDVVTVSGYLSKSKDNPSKELTNDMCFSYAFTMSDYDYSVATYFVSTESSGYIKSDETYTISEVINYSMIQSKDKYGTSAFYIKNNNVLGIKTSENYRENAFLSMLPTIIIIVLIVGIGFFTLRGISGAAGAGSRQAFDFNKSRARLAKSKVKFSDVAGCDEEKVEMTELVDYLKNPNKYKQIGAKLPKGVLLVGRPGTGKTLLAKAVAGEANVPFYSISGSDFVEMYVGVGAGRVRDMFRVAKQNAPCLVFIDEIDAVGRQRGTGLGGGNDEREQTLNQLLVEMDGFEENSGILVVAATNRDDVLDPALLRAGRFDRKITVPLPDLKGREAIFKVHAKNKRIDPSINFEALAKRTVGFSGADIATILNDAAILSVRENKEAIDMPLIDEAIDRRIAGPAKSTHAMSDQEKRTVAYHEAGHAVLGIRYPESDKVQRITIVPRGDTGGHVLITPEKDRYNYTKRQLLARIVSYLGGRTSEEIFFDDITTGAYSDIEVATRIARAMVVEYGMSELGPIQYEQPSGNVFLGRDYTSAARNFSSDVAKAIDKEIRKIIDDAHQAARDYLIRYKDDVVLIAETLLQQETITAEEIGYLLEHRSLEGFQKPVNVPVLEEPKPEENAEEEKKD